MDDSEHMDYSNLFATPIIPLPKKLKLIQNFRYLVRNLHILFFHCINEVSRGDKIDPDVFIALIPIFNPLLLQKK